MTAAAPAITSGTIAIPAQRGPVDVATIAAPTRRVGTAYAILNALTAATVLLLAAPVLLVVALAVKLDGGPVLFRQVRVGKDGREFKVIKFAR